MLSELRYGALLAYSPRGVSEISRRSQNLCYRTKSGDPLVLQRIAQLLREHCSRGGSLTSLFPDGVTLVPVPRSAPLVTGALWPAEMICQALVDAGLATQSLPILERIVAVPKSARARRGERPNVSSHFESLRVPPRLGVTSDILIVDDVVTKGSTAIAAASKIADAYPTATVRLFAAIRTKGLVDEIEKILEPTTGVIQLVGDEGHRQD